MAFKGLTYAKIRLRITYPILSSEIKYIQYVRSNYATIQFRVTTRDRFLTKHRWLP